LMRRSQRDHTLGRHSTIKSVALNELALFCALALCLKHVDGVDRVLGLSFGIHRLDAHHSTHRQIRKEVALPLVDQKVGKYCELNAMI
jgi:hypothetical protein